MYNLTTGKRIAIVNAGDWVQKTAHLYCPANNPKKDEFGNKVEDNTCLRKPKDVNVRHGHSKTMTSRPQIANTDFGSMGEMALMSPTDAGFSVLDMHEKQTRGGIQSTTH